MQPRFNERFILSLGSCSDCLVLDDELNVLPLSKGKDIAVGMDNEDDRGRKRKAEELKDMKGNLENVDIVGALAKLAKTVDQVRRLISILDFPTHSSRLKRFSPLSKQYRKRRSLQRSLLLLLEVEANQLLSAWLSAPLSRMTTRTSSSHPQIPRTSRLSSNSCSKP